MVVIKSRECLSTNSCNLKRLYISAHYALPPFYTHILKSSLSLLKPQTCSFRLVSLFDHQERLGCPFFVSTIMNLNSFPIHQIGHDDDDHNIDQHSPIFGPNSSSSLSSCCIFFNSSQDHMMGCYDDHHRHQLYRPQHKTVRTHNTCNDIPS